MQREADSYVQVITAGEEPFQIVWASEAWLRLCEYTSPQVLGHTLELIQGPLTDAQAVSSLMNAIRRGDPITLSMVNHTRTGKAFRIHYASSRYVIAAAMSSACRRRRATST